MCVSKERLPLRCCTGKTDVDSGAACEDLDAELQIPPDLVANAMKPTPDKVGVRGILFAFYRPICPFGISWTGHGKHT